MAKVNQSTKILHSFKQFNWKFHLTSIWVLSECSLRLVCLCGDNAMSPR